MHLVRAIGDPKKYAVCPNMRQRRVLENPHNTEYLHRTTGDIFTHFRRDYFEYGDVFSETIDTRGEPIGKLVVTGNTKFFFQPGELFSRVLTAKGIEQCLGTIAAAAGANNSG